MRENLGKVSHWNFFLRAQKRIVPRLRIFLYRFIRPTHFVIFILICVSPFSVRNGSKQNKRDLMDCLKKKNFLPPI